MVSIESLTSMLQKLFSITRFITRTLWDWAVENDKAFVGAKALTVASDATREVLFANPMGTGKTVKVRLLDVRGGADGQVDIYSGSFGATGLEDVVRSAPGTSIPVIRKKVGGSNTSSVIFEFDGTYTLNTADHTEGVIPGGSGNFATGGSAVLGLAGEIEEGNAILIRITNKSQQDADYSVRIEWWEE